MQTNMVRQPILTRNKEIVGYEILCQGEVPNNGFQMDVQAANAMEDFLLQLDSEKFLEGKVAYITLSPNLLLKDIPKMFAPNQLVIQIEDNTIVHPLAQRVVYRYQKQGYRMALMGFESLPRYFQFMDAVDIIKVDFTKYRESSLDRLVAMVRSLGKEMIGYHVDSPEAYERACGLGIEILQGSAIAPALAIHRDKAGNFATPSSR